MGVDTANGVGVILVDGQGRFLLQLRDDIEDIDWPGMWGIVGGAIEVDEAPYDAAVRETKEEIGQGVRRLDLSASSQRFDGAGRFTCSAAVLRSLTKISLSARARMRGFSGQRR